MSVWDLVKIQKERKQAMLQVEELQGEVQLLQLEKDLMYKPIDNILSCITPSLSYPLYLQKKCFFFN